MITKWTLPIRLFLLYCVVVLVGSCGTDGLRDRLSQYNDELKRTEGYSWSIHDSLHAIYPRVIDANDAVTDSLYNKVVTTMLLRAETSGAFNVLFSYDQLSQDVTVVRDNTAGEIAQIHRLGISPLRSRSALLSALWFGPSAYASGNLCGNLAMAYMGQGLYGLADRAAVLASAAYEGMNDWRGQKWPLRLRFTIAMEQGDRQRAESYLRSFSVSLDQYLRLEAEDGYTTAVSLLHDILRFSDSSRHAVLAFGANHDTLRRMYDSLQQAGVRPWLLGRSAMTLDTVTVYPKPILRELADHQATLLMADSTSYTIDGSLLLYTGLGTYRWQGRTWRLVDTPTRSRGAMKQSPVALWQYSTAIECLHSVGQNDVFIATADSLFIRSGLQQHGVQRSVLLQQSLLQSHVRRLDDSLFLLVSPNGVDIFSIDLQTHVRQDINSNDAPSRYWSDLLAMQPYDSRRLGSHLVAVSVGDQSGVFTFDPTARTLQPLAVQSPPLADTRAADDPLIQVGLGPHLMQLYNSRLPESGLANGRILIGPRFFGQDWASTATVGVPTIGEPYILLIYGTSGIVVDTLRQCYLPIENIPLLTYAEHGRFASLTRPMTVVCNPQPVLYFADDGTLYQQHVPGAWNPLEPRLHLEDVTDGVISTVALHKGVHTVGLEPDHAYRLYMHPITPSFGFAVQATGNRHLSVDARGTHVASLTTLAHVVSFRTNSTFTEEHVTIPFTQNTITLAVSTPLYTQPWFLWTMYATGLGSFIFTLITLYRNARRRREDAIEQAKQEQMSVLREDMHDMIGSRLSRIASLSRQRDGKEVADQLDKIQEIALTTVRSLRNLLSLMAETNLTDAEFFGTVREFMVGACDDASVACTARVEVDEHSQLSSEDRHQLLMICSELVTNSIRHAQCTHTWLTINGDHGSYDIVWEDDGVGIDPAKPRGHGLNNIQRRCGRIGADVSFVQRQPHGTSVLIRVATTKEVA